MTNRETIIKNVSESLADCNSRHHHEVTDGDRIEAEHIADRLMASGLAGENHGVLIFDVVAQIREIIGVGVKPMLSELPDAVRAAVGVNAELVEALDHYVKRCSRCAGASTQSSSGPVTVPCFRCMPARVALAKAKGG